jgi:hypothetical protein
MAIKLHITKQQFVNNLVEAMADGETQRIYRDSFVRLLAKTRRGKQPNTPPFTKRARVGKSGPVGSP